MLRALLTIGAVQMITMLVLLVRTKTLAVMLGPELVGIMAVIDKLLAVIAQTASLSLPFAAVRFLPERWAVGPAEYRDLFARMRNVLLGMVLGAMLGALVISLYRPATWGAELLPHRDTLAVAILGLPAIALIPFLQNAVAGRMQQNRSMLVGFLHAIVLAIGIVGIWWGGLAGYYAVYALLGTVLVVVVTHLATVGTTTRAAQGESRRRFHVGLPAPLWRFAGALLTLAFIVPYAALFIFYQLLSNHGAEAAGWMQAAMGISLSVRGVLGSAHAVFLTPNVNRGGIPPERMEWANHFQLTFCLLAGLFVPPLLLFPDIVVQLLYSSAFLPGAAFVIVFVLAEVLAMLSGTYQSLVVALDHMRFHVASNVVAQLLVVTTAYFLIGPFGIFGAGLACLVAPVFLFVTTMIFLNRSYALRIPGRVIARSVWLIIGLLAAGLIGTLSLDSQSAMLLLKASVYALIVGGFAWLLTPQERQQIRQALDSLRANLQ